MAVAESWIVESALKTSSEQTLPEKRKQLLQSLHINLNDDTNWVWLAHAASDPAQKLRCIQTALEINPSNAQALQLQARLQHIDAAEIVAQAAVPSGELGPFVARTRLNWMMQFTRLINVILLAAISVGAPMLSLELRIMPLRLLLLLIGVVALGITIVEIYPLLKSFTKRIDFYERGFVSRRFFFLRQTYLWQQVSEVTFDTVSVLRLHFLIPRYDTLHTTVVWAGGRKVLDIDDNVAEPHTLGDLIAQLSFSTLTQRYLAALERGELLVFRGDDDKAVSVSRDGIHCQGVMLDRRRITEFSFVNHVLMIRYGVREPLFSIDLNGVANSHVLVMLVEKLVNSTTIEEVLGFPVKPLEETDL